MGDFICVVPSGYQHSTHWVSWLQVTLAFQKEKHAPLQAFCFLKWPLGADTQSQHTTGPSFTLPQSVEGFTHPSSEYSNHLEAFANSSVRFQ